MTTMKIKNNTIEITKTFAQKAARVGSPEYYELLKVRQENPSCTVEVKQTKSKAFENSHMWRSSLHLVFSLFQVSKQLHFYE